MTHKAILKKNGGLNWGPTGLNQSQIEVFRHFLKFGSYVFHGIAYDDSPRQFLTSSGGKTHEKKLGVPNLDQSDQNWVRN